MDGFCFPSEWVFRVKAMLIKRIYQTKEYSILLVLILLVSKVYGQQSDSLKEETLSIHVQATTITQVKPAFHAKYTGQNSLIPGSETKLSYTSTFFLCGRLWSGASLTFNPELAGGSGLSGSLGVGASTNGEAYRIDNPSPKLYLARLFFKQYFFLSQDTKYQPGDLNTLAGKVPESYISVILGKISMTDFFDNNGYSHDPRTQFMSWALMSNGAWDFPANTRGYTPSLVIEYVTPKNELRYGFSLVSLVANGMTMNWNIAKASSQTLEYTHNYTIDGNKGAIRLLAFFTSANMGNYDESLALNPSAPNLLATEKYGHTKYGFGINAEQALTKDLGGFLRASWNDGNNESWEFTEIDRSVSLGLSLSGIRWHRQNDNLGLAVVTSGLSAPHRNYLKAGGKGFELGDGNLNYAWEHLAELYYSLEISKSLFLSGACQLILNPGYNIDRGPVNVFSLKLHMKF